MLQRHFKDLRGRRVNITLKPVLSGHFKRTQRLVFNTNFHLMQVKSIAECSKGSILQYFRPPLILLLCFVFNVPPTAKVIWRRGHGLKPHESDRLVKPEMEPATPGSQGKRFIHYATAAPRPLLSYQIPLRPEFCLFLSGRLRRVLLYVDYNMFVLTLKLV